MMTKKEKCIERIIKDISYPHTRYTEQSGLIERIKNGLLKMNSASLGNLNFLIDEIITQNILMDAKLLRKNIEIEELKQNKLEGK